MTMPRKGSRAIEVGGRNYRWMVKDSNVDVSKKRLVVEDEVTGELHKTTRVWPEDMVTTGDVIKERFS